MARSELAVFTNMCMIYDEAGRILVQERNKQDWPGITFPGGHVEPGESFVESVTREVYEETGLHISRPRLCGVKQFQDKQDARYVVMLYKTNQFEGQLRSSTEGEVFWIKRHKLHEYTLAPDFDKMLEVFEKEEHSEFYYAADWRVKLL